MNAHEKDLKRSLELKHSHLDTVKRKFEITANRQELKGMEKYGQPLDPLDNYDWLKMALEEQVDGTKYLVAEMEKREFIVNKIRKLMKYKSEWIHYEEIMHWLDELGGSEMKEAERILVNGTWLGVGGNTPWGIEGKIESITVYEDDPRDMAGADSTYIKIKFDSGCYLEVKTKEYMILRKENENN